MTSVAVVTPWYGSESTGGAESLARELAARLARRGLDVTVITTCSRSFLSRWDVNYYEPGESVESGYHVRRFLVAPRDVESFDNVNASLLGLPRQDWALLRGRDKATAAFIDESINSVDLEAHLFSYGRRYDAVLFLPYLYGVIVRGIAALGSRAHLIPCLHDEAYARIPRIATALHQAATLLFNSDGEAELARRIYGPGVLHKSFVIGSGIEAPVDPSTSAIPFIDNSPFVLYLGRRDTTKNTDFLVNSYLEFRKLYPESALRLVLAGPGERTYGSPGMGVVDLGFVDDAMKRQLLQKTAALLQPSANESYSRVIMEAWRERRPVVVHRECLATATAVREAGGGMLAGDRDEWIEVLASIERGDFNAESYGARGEAYARTKSDWDQVVDRLLQAVGLGARNGSIGQRVDQVVQTLEYGDAISDYAVHLCQRLRSIGFESTIWAESVGPLVLDKAEIYEHDRVRTADALLYHHSIGTRVTDHVVSLDVPKAVIYHNITPASFFAPYRPSFAELLEAGRADLVRLVGAFDAYVADSDYNAGELRELGIGEVETVPVIMDFSRFDVSADLTILRDEGRGMRWLFVGRVAPNKGIRALIQALEAFLYFDPDARLFIVGRYEELDPYYLDLRRFVAVRRLDANVIFTGIVSDEQLTAYYQRADVFITLSEHEGFCVPVVEAMFFDVPIVALAQAALPETLGAAGILLEPGISPEEVAALIYHLRTDAKLCALVMDAQRSRRDAFLPNAVYPKLERTIAGLLH